MARITPGEVITHTPAEILDIVGGGSSGLQGQIDQLTLDFGELDTNFSTINSSVANLDQNVATLQSDVSALEDAVTAHITDIQQVTIGLESAQNAIAQTQTDVGQVQTDLGQTQTDLGNTISDLDQAKIDLENTKLDLVALDSTVTTLPRGTIVVTSLPAHPNDIGGGMTLYLNVIDPDDRGLYAWDGTAWVSPSKLTDGSVTASKLSPGLIFSAEIEAGEVKETHIADDSISSPKIRAGAVTTSKLVVGNFANLCENNDFELGDSSWTKGQGWTINNEPTESYNGVWIAKRAGYVSASALRNVLFKCVQGQKYIAQAHIKRGTGADGHGFVRVVTYDTNGAETIVGEGNQITASTFTMSEVTVEVPVGAVNIRVEVVATNTTGFIYVDQGVLSINSLTVIEDGSITTDKLATNAVTAEKILAGTITANEMTITSLSSLTGNMGNLTSGTITIDAAGHIKSDGTSYSAGTGFWLGYDGGFYKTRFGSLTNGFSWNGSTLSIYGASININNKFTTDTSGNVVIRSGTSGARLEIKNDVIKVFDASGVLRVQLGNLDV